VTRHVGAQIAAGIVSGILFILSVAVFVVLWRWNEVPVVQMPTGHKDKEWHPVILGYPSSTTRLMNLLEMGRMSRWYEIRKMNGLIK
jgi:hypothetical protein